MSRQHWNLEEKQQYIHLKLASLGYRVSEPHESAGFLRIADSLLRQHQERNANAEKHCPVDNRIQTFLERYLQEVPGHGIKLPTTTFTLDYPGIARVLSLPPDRDLFESDIVKTYRVRQGVLHNPKNDRRTTQGVFHVCEGGSPIPDDKTSVPKAVFAKLLAAALRPPKELLQLPFTASSQAPAEVFVSLLLRPIVVPEVPGISEQKSMEVRFIAPGNLVGNLDFVETIFGNGGDPWLAQNDSALDIDHWTGHTGCVILAPHLITQKKKDLGLPHISQATERQRAQGMCWEKDDELYNNGNAFKITCRDSQGVIVTVIADNYFGYCKKEVKTQISYASNLFGLSEEEHSGGAIAFASYDLGEEFSLKSIPGERNTFDEAVKMNQDRFEVHPDGYAVNRQFPNIVLVHHEAKFHLPSLSISWPAHGKTAQIKLQASRTYVSPTGYKIYIKKQTGGHAWHLIGVVPEGVLCHKPCTVSGGGKSEISKSIVDAMIQGAVYVADFKKDMDLVEEILNKDYGSRFLPQFAKPGKSRPILSPQRTLGSVIKLLTLSPEYTDAYNDWLRGLPPHIREIVLAVKRFYQPEWGAKWRDHFSVDVINGHVGHELKLNNRKLVANYLRIGREKDGSWRTYRVRTDFAAAEKVQVADDITASVLVPRRQLKNLNPAYPFESVKLIKNCENYLFQRPDDAIYRGYDKQAELDLATPDTFISNFEPLTCEKIFEIIDDFINFDLYTSPMKKMLRSFAENGAPDYAVSSAHPRMVNGKPSKNPRYLQKRLDHVNPQGSYAAELGARLRRGIRSEDPVYFPVNAVLPGRRNNPPDKKNGVPALAVYNPIHYQELPELFLDFICSLTGKSPSTTGFGSEGALTKGPFNALSPVIDLNNALLSFIISGYQGFSSAAGHIGPNYRVDHDISLLIPEIWCRMSAEEQNADYLIRHGHLEKVEDFEYQGKTIPASLLGYRITKKFVRAFLGRIFNNPDAVFHDEMLAPEKQSVEVFAEGIENILVTQKRVALHYFQDGSIEAACPPLKALLHIMAHGHYESKDLNHPQVRNLFKREAVMESAWYKARLAAKQDYDRRLWTNHIRTLETYAASMRNEGLDLTEKIEKSRKKLAEVEKPAYLESLVGTLGSDPYAYQNTAHASQHSVQGKGTAV